MRGGGGAAGIHNFREIGPNAVPSLLTKNAAAMNVATASSAKNARYTYTAKLSPQPQLRLALGFLK
jgi:hypothetical protein